MASNINTATNLNAVVQAKPLYLHIPPIVKSFQSLGFVTPYYPLCPSHSALSSEQCYLIPDILASSVCSSAYSLQSSHGKHF